MLLPWLKPKTNFLQVDLHSHLIPGLDDGVANWDEALSILKEMRGLGFDKVITTPHVIHDYYPNEPVQITEGVSKLNRLTKEAGLDIKVESGAEYFVDEHFAQKVKQGDHLITFGDDYILIETPFMNKPVFLEEVIFDLQANGLKPILAHPERYVYLQKSPEYLEALAGIGTLFQINISSLIGYYSIEAKQFGKMMVQDKMVNFLGSDIHNHKHLSQVKKTITSKLFQKCRQLDLLNNSL